MRELVLEDDEESGNRSLSQQEVPCRRTDSRSREERDARLGMSVDRANDFDERGIRNAGVASRPILTDPQRTRLALLVPGRPPA